MSTTGTLSINFWPPLPGVTPATMLVPYARHCSAWKLPAEPVMPCTTSLVSLLTNTLMINFV